MVWKPFKQLFKKDKKTLRERRKYLRVAVASSIVIDDWQSRRVSDLSVDGMFLSTDDVFPEDSVIDLKFKFDDTNSLPIEVKAKVRHVRKGHGMGVQFLNLKPDDAMKIKRHIDKLWFQKK